LAEHDPIGFYALVNPANGFAPLWARFGNAGMNGGSGSPGAASAPCVRDGPINGEWFRASSNWCG
jgi:hypothetical protein